jgi:hypothetical protein
MSSKLPQSKPQSSVSSELQDLGTTYSAKMIKPLIIERVPITFASDLMTLAAFVEATQKRNQAFQDHSDVGEEEEPEPAEPAVPIFSIHNIVREYGPGYIAEAFKFSWDEFQYLFDMVRQSLRQSGLARKRMLDLIDRFLFSCCI